MSRAGPLKEMQKSLSNWERWGPDDERGTLNLLRPEHRRRAATLIEEGLAVSLAHSIDPTRAYLAHRPARVMIRTGPDEALDVLELPVHGVLDTHLDSLGHFFDGDVMYGGRSAEENVSVAGGLAKCAIDVAKDGIFTRAVLLDAPAWRSVEFIPGGESVGRDEIEAAERRLGLNIGEGDVVLLRTGHARLPRPTDVEAFTSASWSLDALALLQERGVVAVGCDGPNETIPSPVSDCPYPFHQTAIVYMGLWLFDNVDLERMAELCETRGRSAFAFSATPLAFPGATGSPVNPVGIL